MVAGLVIGDQLLVMGMSMNNGGAERRCPPMHHGGCGL